MDRILHDERIAELLARRGALWSLARPWNLGNRQHGVAGGPGVEVGRGRISDALVPQAESRVELDPRVEHVIVGAVGMHDRRRPDVKIVVRPGAIYQGGRVGRVVG